MKFKQIYAYRIGPNGMVDKTLVKHLLTETSICSMSVVKNDDEHFLIDLSNGVSLKVPGDIDEFRVYLENDESI